MARVTKLCLQSAHVSCLGRGGNGKKTSCARQGGHRGRLGPVPMRAVAHPGKRWPRGPAPTIADKNTYLYRSHITLQEPGRQGKMPNASDERVSLLRIISYKALYRYFLAFPASLRHTGGYRVSRGLPVGLTPTRLSESARLLDGFTPNLSPRWNWNAVICGRWCWDTQGAVGHSPRRPCPDAWTLWMLVGSTSATPCVCTYGIRIPPVLQYSDDGRGQVRARALRAATRVGRTTCRPRGGVGSAADDDGGG